MVNIKWTSWTATFIALLMLLQPERSNTANILALFPFSSRSHNNVYSTITKALAQKGHHFTVITAAPIDSPPPNYKQINVYKDVEKHLNVFNSTERNMGIIEMVLSLKCTIDDVCQKPFNNPEIKRLLNPSETGERFDLILATTFFSECYYGFAHIYKVPIILISPNGPMVNTQSTVGNVALPSAISHSMTGYSDRMTFQQRVVNTLTTWAFSLYYNYIIMNSMESKMREVFGEDIPTISELDKSVSLVLLNHHFSLNEARPSVPNLVEVGFLHVKPPKELPTELKSFLDSAGKDGVIYFSLGSVLKSANFPVEIRDAFIGAFSQVKQKVLWKWEGDSPLPGQSKNVRLEKWLPQQDLLAHPNVKLFITHGGLLSFQEATTRGVPLIGIPYFGDQESNMNRVTELEVGVKLDSTNLTKENILNAINKVLGDSTYSTNMKKMHSVVTDQINDPLERAVYWIEYVLRHNGAKHLRAASADLAWYQLYMFDVLFVLVVMPLLVFFSIIYIIIKLLKKCCSKKKAVKTSNKKAVKSSKKIQ